MVTSVSYYIRYGLQMLHFIHSICIFMWKLIKNSNKPNNEINVLGSVQIEIEIKKVGVLLIWIWMTCMLTQIILLDPAIDLLQREIDILTAYFLAETDALIASYNCMLSIMLRIDAHDSCNTILIAFTKKFWFPSLWKHRYSEFLPLSFEVTYMHFLGLK